ncbi:hypothetical protein D3C71_1712660 [compost metagenome]
MPQSKLRHAQHRVERCADFMAHGRQKACLVCGGLLCGVLGLSQNGRLLFLLTHIQPHPVEHGASLFGAARGCQCLEPACFAVLGDGNIKVKGLECSCAVHKSGLRLLHCVWTCMEKLPAG